ncbi:MAG: LOG family protein [Alphaproteobacteria bacterium]|nr:LOG family protein [Alphaproteobacteria bacterium]
MKKVKNNKAPKAIEAFVEENSSKGLRVFVAGGARSGNDNIYTEEAYNLGRQIVKMGLKLDFGLSNSGIMGAVARGVLDTWQHMFCNNGELPIKGITTSDYFCLYPQDDELLKQISNIIFAKTLEERKQRLLRADFVVFAPGGVGTLDELAYDCVAMQDGFLDLKPFILYNVNGYFYHLLEYLKQIAAKGFANPLPFIVVDNSQEIEIVFRLLKLRYENSQDVTAAYANTRQLIYELPYFLKNKTDNSVFVEDIIKKMEKIRKNGTDEEKLQLNREIEQAYLEKEINRMNERVEKTFKDTKALIEKLVKLEQRQKI